MSLYVMPRWVWESTRPGRTVRSERSMSVAPAGTARSAPTAVTFSPAPGTTACGAAAGAYRGDVGGQGGGGEHGEHERADEGRTSRHGLASSGKVGSRR